MSSSGPNAGAKPGVGGFFHQMSERFVVHFAVAKGEVLQRGTLEQSRSWQTDSRNGTLGKFFQSGWFGAYSRGRSNTVETVMKSISILRIGGTTFAEIDVPGRSCYETLTEHSLVGCVLSADQRRIYAVINHSTGANLEFEPDWGAARKLRSWGLLLLVLFGGLGLLSLAGGIGIALICLLIAGASGVSMWVGRIALARSRDVYAQAVVIARTR